MSKPHSETHTAFPMSSDTQRIAQRADEQQPSSDDYAAMLARAAAAQR